MVPGWFSAGLELVREGTSTNWWGLACPAHCQGTSFGAILAGFFAGCLVGAFAVAGLVLYLYISCGHKPQAPSQAPPETLLGPLARRRQDRLRGYLDAQDNTAS